MVKMKIKNISTRSYYLHSTHNNSKNQTIRMLNEIEISISMLANSFQEYAFVCLFASHQFST